MRRSEQANAALLPIPKLPPEFVSLLEEPLSFTSLLQFVPFSQVSLPPRPTVLKSLILKIGIISAASTPLACVKNFTASGSSWLLVMHLSTTSRRVSISGTSAAGILNSENSTVTGLSLPGIAASNAFWRFSRTSERLTFAVNVSIPASLIPFMVEFWFETNRNFFIAYSFYSSKRCFLSFFA